MTPVLFLSDGYLANGAEPWRIPPLDEIANIPVNFEHDPKGFQPYRRDPRTLARPWALPGTPGLEHRLGGLESRENTGNVSYDPLNHEKMCVERAEKVKRIALDVPLLEVEGPAKADVLVVAWGSTYGAVCASVERARKKGYKVAHAHLRYLHPLPRNMGQVLRQYPKVLCPENNLGQLSMLLRAEFLVDVIGLNKVQGQPFKKREILAGIEALLAGRPVRQPGENA